MKEIENIKKKIINLQNINGSKKQIKRFKQELKEKLEQEIKKCKNEIKSAEDIDPWVLSNPPPQYIITKNVERIGELNDDLEFLKKGDVYLQTSDKKKIKKALLRTYSLEEINQKIFKINLEREKIAKELDQSHPGWRMTLFNPPPPNVTYHFDLGCKIKVLKEIIETYGGKNED